MVGAALKAGAEEGQGTCPRVGEGEQEGEQGGKAVSEEGVAGTVAGLLIIQQAPLIQVAARCHLHHHAGLVHQWDHRDHGDHGDTSPWRPQKRDDRAEGSMCLPGTAPPSPQAEAAHTRLRTAGANVCFSGDDTSVLGETRLTCSALLN